VLRSSVAVRTVLSAAIQTFGHRDEDFVRLTQSISDRFRVGWSTRPYHIISVVYENMAAEPDSTSDDVRVERSAGEKKKMTKRQNRKQVNEKNKWPQHPKIQDMEVRNKAYIRVAGLGASTKQKEMIDPKLDLLSPEVKFGRLLGSTDQRKRHLAVQKLKSYLKARCDINHENGGISELDLLKLWKGLWYTLYMADKVPVQHELSKHLAELLWCVAGTEEEDEYAGQAYMSICEERENGEDGEDEEDSSNDDEDSDGPEVTLEEIENTLDESDSDCVDENEMTNDNGEDEMEDDDDEDGESAEDALEEEEEEDEESMDNSEVKHCRGAHLVSIFVRTFFRTVRREWGRMDKYRVDKFYTLARMYMHEIYLYMSKRHWNIGIIRLFNDAMFEEVLRQKPNGLRYHLIDIALDELAKVNADAPMPLTEATFLDAMEPYLAMCQTGAGGDDSVQSRVMENILQKFLNKYSFISEADSEEAKALIFNDVHVGTVAKFIFELASDPETKDQYRKSIYDMHKAFMRRLKVVGKDVEIEPGQTDGEDADSGDENETSEQEDLYKEDYEEQIEEVVPPTQPSKKEKKKRKTPNVDDQTNEGNSASTDSAKKKEKKKVKQGSTALSDEMMEADVETNAVGDGHQDIIEENEKKAVKDEKKEKKEKKKKKKRSLESTEANEGNDEHKVPEKVKNKKIKQSESKNESSRVEEEVVTISVGDQRKAKAFEKETQKAQKKQHKATTVQDPDSSRKQGRRVKWLPNNKSISYTASMKGLATTTPPNTSEVTPEKGILLNKGKPRRAGVSKVGRKKAVNYF